MEFNKLYNEDCLNTMARMEDKSIDLVITSPPYNMRTRIRNGKYTKREKAEHFSKKYGHFPDDLPVEEFYKLHSGIMSELLRVSKTVCYNFQIVTGSKEAFFKIIGDNAQYIKDIIIWDKGHGQPAMHAQVMNSCYEMIAILQKEDKGAAGRAITGSNFERGKMDNIIRVTRGTGLSARLNKEFFEPKLYKELKATADSHGAVFPEELVVKLLKAFSKEGDLIYDPFTGTGTVPVVAGKLGRNWVGSELMAPYYRLAYYRYKMEMGILA